MKRTLILFLSLSMAFLLTLLVAILLTDKAELHQLLTLGFTEKMSESQLAFCDKFFRYITELGGSIPIIVGIAVLFFFKLANGLQILISQGLVALVVQPIKFIVAAPRPALFFSEHFPDIALHQVEGVTQHMVNSFPSGHTAAVFSFMLSLAILCHRWPKTSVLFFVLAAIGGYSRIYLSQHFAVDVCVGASIGIAMTLFIAWALRKNERIWGKLNSCKLNRWPKKQ